MADVTTLRFVYGQQLGRMRCFERGEEVGREGLREGKWGGRGKGSGEGGISKL